MNEKLIWHTIADDDLKYADQVCEFLQNNFQPIGSDPIWFKDYFKWKLSAHNPAGRGYLSVGFEGDKIISCISLVKRKIYFGSHTIIGAEFGDAYCSADFFTNINNYAPRDNNYQSKPSSHYLNRSVFGRIADEITIRAINDGVFYLYGLPNENAHPSWIKRLGHFNFSNHSIYSLSRQTGIRRINNSRFASRLKKIGKLIDRLHWDYKLFKSNFWSDQKFRIENHFPDKSIINSIWDYNKNMYDFQLVRDYDYWKHRYFDHPLKKYQIFTVLDQGKIIGLCVTALQRISIDKTVLFLVEWMINTDASVSEILFKLLEVHRRDDFDVINVNVSSKDPLFNVLQINSFDTNFKVNITFRETFEVNSENFRPKTFMLFLGNTDAV